MGLLGAPGVGQAQVPRLLHYQATLLSETFPVEAPVDLSFAFYDADEGGDPIAGWSERRTDVALSEGRVSVLLGAETPLPVTLFERSPLFLEPTVNGTALPRLRLASTAYALRAATAERVGANGVDADALAAGAVGSVALMDRAVTARTVAEGAITAQALAPGAVGAAVLAEGSVTSAALGARAVVERTLADGSVTTAKLANGTVTAAKIGSGQVVTALNGVRDGVRLIGGRNVRIVSNPDAGTIQIEMEGGGDTDAQTAQTAATAPPELSSGDRSAALSETVAAQQRQIDALQALVRDLQASLAALEAERATTP